MKYPSAVRLGYLSTCDLVVMHVAHTQVNNCLAIREVNLPKLNLDDHFIRNLGLSVGYHIVEEHYCFQGSLLLFSFCIHL